MMEETYPSKEIATTHHNFFKMDDLSTKNPYVGNVDKDLLYIKVYII
jgi:hypothetical protein